jgi:hypothetical protein
MWLFMIGADPQGPIYKLSWIGDDVIEATLCQHGWLYSTSGNDIHRHHDGAVVAMAPPAGSCITRYLHDMTNTLMRHIKIL